MSKVRNVIRGSTTLFSRLLVGAVLTLAGTSVAVAVPAAVAHAAQPLITSYHELKCGSTIPTQAGTYNQGEPDAVEVGWVSGVPCQDVDTGQDANIVMQSATPANACTIYPPTGEFGSFTTITFNAVGNCTFEMSYPGDTNSPQYWKVQINPSPNPSGGGGPTSPGGTTYPAGEQAAQGCVVMPSGSVVGMAATPDDQGYWIVDSAGQVDDCGDATNYGEPATTPPSPIVGIALDAAGTGYWIGRCGRVWRRTPTPLGQYWHSWLGIITQRYAGQS
jgi:hypothetical protein